MTHDTQEFLDYTKKYIGFHSLKPNIHDYHISVAKNQIKGLYELVTGEARVAPTAFLKKLPKMTESAGLFLKHYPATCPYDITKDCRIQERHDIQKSLSAGYYRMLAANNGRIQNITRVHSNTGYPVISGWINSLIQAPHALFPDQNAFHSARAQYMFEDPWIWSIPTLFKPNSIDDQGPSMLRDFCDGYKADGANGANEGNMTRLFAEQKIVLGHYHRKSSNDTKSKAALLIRYNDMHEPVLGFAVVQGQDLDGKDFVKNNALFATEALNDQDVYPHLLLKEMGMAAMAKISKSKQLVAS